MISFLIRFIQRRLGIYFVPGAELGTRGKGWVDSRGLQSAHSLARKKSANEELQFSVLGGGRVQGAWGAHRGGMVVSAWLGIIWFVAQRHTQRRTDGKRSCYSDTEGIAPKPVREASRKPKSSETLSLAASSLLSPSSFPSRSSSHTPHCGTFQFSLLFCFHASVPDTQGRGEVIGSARAT